MIENSKFIVCPYRDATQSGVLMTSYAAGKMVLATNVGSFPEYIQDGVNGLLAEVTPESIAQKIIEGLDE
ncbi:MAG: glycosyltransferase [Ferruginibacter sp.]